MLREKLPKDPELTLHKAIRVPTSPAINLRVLPCEDILWIWDVYLNKGLKKLEMLISPEVQCQKDTNTNKLILGLIQMDLLLPGQNCSEKTHGTFWV